MNRHLLRTFIQGLLAASAPVSLAGCGCSSSVPETEIVFDANLPDGPLPVDDGGNLPLAACEGLCPPGTQYSQRALTSCSLAVVDGGKEVICQYDHFTNCVRLLAGGRHPAGLVPASIASATPVGAVLAQMAHQEAAAVRGFRRLAVELGRFGAPEELIAAARRAAREEVRHARLATRLAKRYGAEASPVVVRPPAERTLLEFAIENQEEGCVNEAWGAMIAALQTTRAADPAVRAMMAEILDDEIGHAALGMAVGEWAESSLTPDGRRRLEEAKGAALDQLAEAVSQDLVPACAREALGLPGAAEASAILAEARTAVWRA